MTRYEFDLETVAACQIAALPEIYDDYIGYKTDGYFVDIGAFNGRHWSNTEPLAKAGWGGIMVEPSKVFALLQENYSGNEKIKLVNCGIGLYNCNADFYRQGSESTFIQEITDKHTSAISATMITMNSLLEDSDCPVWYDVLSIDVEGGEIGVFAGYEINRWRPKLAIVEMNENHANRMLAVNAAMIATYFDKYDYVRVYADAINSVFLDRRP